MKYIISLGLVLISLINVRTEGMVFHHGTWAEALALAKETGQLIFVDAYTTWCGPCKLMSAKTFPQKSVGDFYNANFINVKLDMERGEGLQFADTYNVSSYPSLFYIDGEAKLVMKAVGYMEAEKFIEAGKSALKKNDKTALYAKAYDSGKRDFVTVYQYIRALNQAGKPSLKIANEYINAQKDLNTAENLRLIYEAAIESDSRVFDLMVKFKEPLKELFGADKVKNRMLQAGHKTVKKAVEYQSIDLLSAAQAKINTVLPEEKDVFEFTSNLNYYTSTGDAENLYKAMKKMPASAEKDPDLIKSLATAVEKSFNADPKLIGLCEQLLPKVINSSSSIEDQFVLARIYALNQKNDKAYRLIDQLISQAKSKNMDVLAMEQFKSRLNSLN
ncbi:MAG: thioredoxin family protein [Saprospiraceae bacterium]|nr:thioredoxin family protein [Saprospiraceae bacterium]